MNRDVKRLLHIYKYPGVAFLLIATPGANMLYFHQHALLTPILGMLLLYSLPLWVPYILFRLLRLMRPAPARLRPTEASDPNPTLLKPTLFYRRYGSLSFFLFLALMYPCSYVAAASLNWGHIWGLHWKPSVLYKMFTFPVGFLLPPYGAANQETLDTMLFFAKNLLR